jgi:glutaredoxin-related protein
MRKTMEPARIHPEAAKSIANFHANVVQSIEKAISENEWVVVGMAQNPVVKKARAALDAKGTKFHYIEIGSYFSKWKERLAVKLWSGWPTYPQVFHKGVLIGGFDDLEKYLRGS